MPDEADREPLTADGAAGHDGLEHDVDEEAGVKVTRQQVLAYRFAAQGLHRDATRIDQLAVLDIGVQDASIAPARLAFDARLAHCPPEDPFGPGHRLALVWSLRGAPHVHRRADLAAVAGALYPLSEADAAGRLNETGPSVARAGIAALEQFALATTAMRDAVTRPTPKGTASTTASAALPPAMRHKCRACGTSHLSDSAMRNGALAAGLELEPDTAPPVLRRWPRSRVRTSADPAALRTLLMAYLRLLGPATVADAAGYVEARRADVASMWRDDGLVEVAVDGRTALIPEDALDELTSAPEPAPVRLLSGFDPLLQARDRALIVPDKAAQKALWPVLGRPGAVVVHGDVAGCWRPKASGSTLTIAVEPFGPLPQRVWRAVDAEAERVAAVRGARTVRVTGRD